MHLRPSIQATLMLVVTSLLFSCGNSTVPAATESGPAGANAEPSDPRAKPAKPKPLPSLSFLDQAIDPDEAKMPLRLDLLSEFGYENEYGVLVLDVMERDYLYLTLFVQDAEGRPVRGLRPTVKPERDSRFIALEGEDAVTSGAGGYSFALLGGTMGPEAVEIAVGDAVKPVVLNVISLRAAGYGWLADVEGAVDWTQLFQADIDWGEQELTATFPDEIMAKNGETVKLAGFMVPLEATEKQSRFILASNPPGCYFHVPGGPAGAVEVFAKKPLEWSYDPLMVEGRFEVLEKSESGVLYRLHDARSIEIPRPPEP